MNNQRDDFTESSSSGKDRLGRASRAENMFESDYFTVEFVKIVPKKKRNRVIM